MSARQAGTARGRDFRLFQFGQGVSSFGSAITSVLLGLIAVRYLHASGTEIGLLAAAGSIGGLTLGFAVGAWVDRTSRKRAALVRIDVMSAGLLGAAGVAWLAGLRSFWALVALAVVLGLGGLAVELLYFAHLVTMVDQERLGEARGSLQASEQIGSVAGRAIAGIVLSIGGPATGWLTDAVSYLVDAAALRGIRRPDPARTDPARPDPARTGLERDKPRWRDFGRGAADLYNSPVRGLAAMMLTMAGAWSLAVPATQLFLLRSLNLPTRWYGAMYAFAGLFGIAGSVGGTRLVARLGLIRTAILGLALLAASAVVLPLASGPLVLASLVAATGIAFSAFAGSIANIGETGYILKTLSPDVLGRVLLSLQQAAMVLSLLGTLLGGIMAQGIGPRNVLWVAAGLGGAGLIAFVLRGLATEAPRRARSAR
jgi:predicted MFS family arabinose efflux permease